MSESHEGISRRRALKRIGAATGIAWTLPVVSSIRTPAFAGSPLAGCSGQPFECGDPVVCGTGNNGLDCFCETSAAGLPLCVNDLFCDDLTTCASDAVCPTGWICAPDTCCGSVCLPPCGQAPFVLTRQAHGPRPTASGH
jgi:hypothetical protein